MQAIKLSDQEQKILQQHATKSGIELVRLKALAVLLNSQAVALSTIALSTNRSQRSIERWLADYEVRRLSSLYSGHHQNQNAAKLSREQKETIAEVLKAPPSEYGIPQDFWDVPHLKGYIAAEFGVVYESDTSYHFLLKTSGLRFKYPDKRSPRRQEALIRARIQAIRAEIEPLLLSDEWVVLVSDETRIELESIIRRAWLPKGQRSIVKTERSFAAQNFMGFLDQNSYQCQVFAIDRGNTSETIRVLKQLVQQYPDKKVCVIWDNAQWHRSKGLKQELAKGQALENLHLIALPPYAPETNPIEHVWAYAKNKLANRSEQIFDNIKHQFLNLTHNQIFNYQF